MLSMALMAALFRKPCMNLSMWKSNSTLFLQPTGLSLLLSILLSSSLSLSPPTAHRPACSSLIRLCMFVFVRIWAYALLFPPPPPFGFYPSLPYINSLYTGDDCVYVCACVCQGGGSLNNLAKHLAYWRSYGLPWRGLKGGRVWSGDIYPWFIRRNARLSLHRCGVFPAMHPSLTSHSDKSHYTRGKYPFYFTQPPTTQTREDLFPPWTPTVSIEL